MTTDYDMVVIGGGAAGLTAAGMSAVLGARTALISDNKLGGDCTWQGCVPSKTLLKAARVAHAMRSAAKYGLEPSNVLHEWPRIIGRVHAIREHVYEDADAPPNMEKLGVEVIAAQARFVDRNSVEITSSGTEGRRVVTSRYFIIATGSRPDIPKLEGMDRVPVLTNETLFELKERPERLLVLGAGPVGVEMAQAFQRLGSSVTVVGRSGSILERDDAELAAILRQCLESEGVRLRLGEQIERFEPGLAHLKSGETVPLDAVLVATGRRPNMENLQLQATGVSTTQKGIAVDRHCRTNVKNIFACGDITGNFLFTHMAEHTAKVAVMNAILHVPTSRKDDHVSWCTFTDPELAHAGLGEEELRKRGEKFQVYRFPFSRLDRAITESESTGLVKVFANSRGKVLGASILGAHAGEMIAEYALAIEAKAGLGTIASTIHPYPTYALANRRAADTFAMKVLTPSRVGWIRRIFGFRGSTQGIVSLRQSID
jgi:pyruvate/2-oxoglutarate dehydrogenase complex dihydrolipoamide dehydrogenase (E3) component